MRALFRSLFVLALFQILVPKAYAQLPSPTVEASLQRLDKAVEKVVLAYCEPDNRRAFEGAITGINAMPERKDAVPLHLGTPDFDGFAKAYRDATSTSGDLAAVEKAALNGMVQTFDAEIKFGVFGSYPENPWVGVGLNLIQDPSGVTSVSPFPDAPAARAGIQAGDRLIAVDGTPMTGLSLTEVSRHLRGDPESSVTLTVIRASIEMTFTMKRAIIHKPALKWYMAQGVGVIQFTRFEHDTGDEVKAALLALRRERPLPIGYILDLRNNSGGYLDAVIKVIDQFVDRGPIMTVHPKGLCGSDQIERYKARPGDQTRNARIVILVNSETGSGGEIAAASIQELRQAIIVGQRTVGSTTIDTVFPLTADGNDYLLLTTGTMRTPSGKNFHRIGLVPDILVEASNHWDNSAMERALQMLTATSGK